MQDEVHWQADRTNLRQLWLAHPEWTRFQLAQALHRSLAWVKKWLKRFKQVAIDDRQVFIRLLSPPSPA